MSTIHLLGIVGLAFSGGGICLLIISILSQRRGLRLRCVNRYQKMSISSINREIKSYEYLGLQRGEMTANQQIAWGVAHAELESRSK